jgi:hypothetical protein
MPSASLDVENQQFAEFLEVEPSEPPRKNHRFFRKVHETIELDDVPPIIKSANGNIFWADEQCTRRVGLTTTEARLLLRLLQTDKPENFDYQDYKNMFDDFGKEQQRLQELVDRLPWWNFETYYQKEIWKARIEWLERMKEPRLWLLYLMARRRRIVKQAATRCLQRMREKSEMRRMESVHVQPATPLDVSMQGKPTLERVQTHPGMISDDSQTSEQTSEQHLDTRASRHVSLSQNIVSRLRSSLSKDRNSHHSNSHSRTSIGPWPVFDKPFEATREGIKLQVERLMPQGSPYIVVGWFLRSSSDPKERILQFKESENIFKALKGGESDLRGWRRFVSLKSLQGFGLYKVSS